MSATNATRPESDIELEDNPDGPPVEVDFWKKYNAHLEFPIGSVMSVLAHVLIAAALIFGFFGCFQGFQKDRKPVSLINLGGEDEDGVGSRGQGDPDPAVIGQATPADLKRPDFPQELEDVKEKMAKDLQIDTDDLAIPDAVAASLGALDDALQEKMKAGYRKGDGTSGIGPGGTGADSTRARGLRWVMRFSTRSGRDYLSQLHALNAVVMIPVPPKNDKMIILRDLGNPRVDQYATDSDIEEQSRKIQFQDIRKASNEAIQEALRLPFTPAAFWAFFPRELEDELARKEVAFQNKRPEDIKETIYQVIITGGTAKLQVVGQKLK